MIGVAYPEWFSFEHAKEADLREIGQFDSDDDLHLRRN